MQFNNILYELYVGRVILLLLYCSSSAKDLLRLPAWRRTSLALVSASAVTPPPTSRA